MNPFPNDKSLATPDEIVIVDSYWKSWRKSDWAGTYPRNWSLPVAMETLRQLAERGAQFMVLDSPLVNTLAGWICYEVDKKGRLVLHYLFIKSKLRRRGFSKLLLEGAGFTRQHIYTHRTNDTKYIKALKPPQWGHKPDLARMKSI